MAIPIKYRDLITKISSDSDIDIKLMCGLIEIESSWNTYAIHYDAYFRDFMEPTMFARRCGISEETEMMAQKISWGLAQIEGATARKLGFMDSIPELVKPTVNLEYMSILLGQLMGKYPKIEDTISAYNAGRPITSNQIYVDKVLKAIKSY